MGWYKLLSGFYSEEIWTKKKQTWNLDVANRIKIVFVFCQKNLSYVYSPSLAVTLVTSKKTDFLEVKSSRTSLASRTHFEVLGLEAYKYSKMPCPRPRTELFIDLLKMGQDHALFFFIWNFTENLRFSARRPIFLEHFRVVSLALVSTIPVLALERVCLRKVGPWLWPRTFVFLAFALTSSIMFSTLIFAPPPIIPPNNSSLCLRFTFFWAGIGKINFSDLEGKDQVLINVDVWWEVPCEVGMISNVHM